jgi:KipI family sensor histidine kinase inhibitor
MVDNAGAMAKCIAARDIPGVTDVVASYDSVAVHCDDPLVAAEVRGVLETIGCDFETAGFATGEALQVPVAYGGEHGPDLEHVAAALSLPPEEIVRLHSGALYTVAAVGFSPGFPYLTGLPERLHLPRRATPRRVLAGSVAIAGSQGGVYPNNSQGGWHVIGRTALDLFDPWRDEPALLKPGDRLRFVPGGVVMPKPFRHETEFRAERAIEVIEPGMLTTVQDCGRPGFQHIGVTPGGVADPVKARVANLLVGNPPDAALLECAMQGPVLCVPFGARVAWSGWNDLSSGRPHFLTNDQTIDLRGRMNAPHGYFAIAGGIDVPRVLGSRATDLRAGFGGWHGRPLRTGDRLPVGSAVNGPLPGDWRVSWPAAPDMAAVIELRFLPGVQSDWFSDVSMDAFRSSIYQTTSMTDRTGARLSGPKLSLRESREMASQPVAAGSVQVPPDGMPIVLMAERQTIGGYPQIGHVISADLPRLARAWPGTKIHFREVTLDEARAAWREMHRDIALLETGLRLRDPGFGS